MRRGCDSARHAIVRDAIGSEPQLQKLQRVPPPLLLAHGPAQHSACHRAVPGRSEQAGGWLIARGSRSHAARDRTRHTIARGTRSHAARAPPRPTCARGEPENNLVMPTSAGMVSEGELARLVAHARTNCLVPNLRGQCASSETSVSRAKNAARAMGVQRWQSQAGLPKARQASIAGQHAHRRKQALQH